MSSGAAVSNSYWLLRECVYCETINGCVITENYYSVEITSKGHSCCVFTPRRSLKPLWYEGWITPCTCSLQGMAPTACVRLILLHLLIQLCPSLQPCAGVTWAWGKTVPPMARLSRSECPQGKGLLLVLEPLSTATIPGSQGCSCCWHRVSSPAHSQGIRLDFTVPVSQEEWLTWWKCLCSVWAFVVLQPRDKVFKWAPWGSLLPSDKSWSYLQRLLTCGWMPALLLGSPPQGSTAAWKQMKDCCSFGNK